MGILLTILLWFIGVAAVGFLVVCAITVYAHYRYRKEAKKLGFFEEKEEKEGMKGVVEEYWIAKNQFDNADPDKVDEAVERLNLAEMEMYRVLNRKKGKKREQKEGLNEREN